MAGHVILLLVNTFKNVTALDIFQNLIVRQYLSGSMVSEKDDEDITSELCATDNIGCCCPCITLLHFLLRQ